MRILMLHNKYRIPGGEDVSTHTEASALRNFGHKVDLLEWNNNDLNENHKVRNAINSIWSRESINEVRTRLVNEHYDIIHVQNYFPQISPAVHYLAKSLNVPTVQHLRNFRYSCVNAQFFRNGRSCHLCLKTPVPIAGIYHGCYRDNRLASFAAASMIGFHKAIGTWKKSVSRYIAVSEYVKNMHVSAGLPSHKILVRANLFARPNISKDKSRSKEMVLLISRLSEEKGVYSSLRSWQSEPRNGVLNVVGSGPMEGELRSLFSNDKSIRFLGQKSHVEVIKLLSICRFVIMPSLWDEPFGRVALEAMSVGAPVLATRAGGIPEIIGENSKTLVNRGDSENWETALITLLNDDAFVQSESERLQKRFIEKFSIDQLVLDTIKIYEESIESFNRGSPSVNRSG